MAKLFDLNQLASELRVQKNRSNLDFLYNELLVTRNLCKNFHAILEAQIGRASCRERV